jgi:hypothetical protein
MVLRKSSPGSHACLCLLDETCKSFASCTRSEDDVNRKGGVCGAEVANACFPEMGARDDVGRCLQCMAALAVMGVGGAGSVSCIVLSGESMLREESGRAHYQFPPERVIFGATKIYPYLCSAAARV